MLQHPLFAQEFVAQKNIYADGVQAFFTQVGEWDYEVVLDINSNKFLISVKWGIEKIEQFEILAIRGFVELSVQFLKLLKKLVKHLYLQAR